MLSGKRSRVHQSAEHEDHVQRTFNNVNLELSAASDVSAEVAAHALITSKATDANLNDVCFKFHQSWCTAWSDVWLTDVISSFLATAHGFYSKDLAEDTLRDYI